MKRILFILTMLLTLSGTMNAEVKYLQVQEKNGSKTYYSLKDDDPRITFSRNGFSVTTKNGTKDYEGSLSAVNFWTFVEQGANVQSVTMNKTSITLDKGQTTTLSVTILPADATDKTVTWMSSDASIATVSDKGVITAKGYGTATITATANDGNGKSASCEVTVNPTLVTGITLSQTTLNMDKGNTQRLTFTIQPSNADIQTVTWTSSNSGVAQVTSDGTVRAMASGTATITATAKDGSGKTAKCTVNVAATKITSITLNKTSAELEKGGTVTLSPSILPSDATNKNLYWSSSNTSVATVENGIVTATGVGTATITAEANDGSGIKATATITVKQVDVTGVEINKTTATLKKGGTVQLTYTVLPSNATNKSVSWTSSNTAVATVDASGKVTAKAVGTATITVTTTDGSKTAKCEITVEKTPVTGITINKTSAQLKGGETLELTATIQPADATDLSVTWSSSDEAVATVDASGKVTAKAVGTATITVTTTDGSKTAKCEITVEKTLITSITLNKTSVQMKSGETLALTATVKPTNATDLGVIWSSSNEAVATVDASGKVTAVAGGSVTITATAADGSQKTAKCEITIQETKITSITIQSSLILFINDTKTLATTIKPATALDKTLLWTSSNPLVAMVDPNTGLITAMSKGEAIIKAVAMDGSKVEASCTVTVSGYKVSEIQLSQNTATLLKGQTLTLTHTVLPDDAVSKSVSWTSSDTNVATVDKDGTVTAIAAGTATITVKANDGSGVSASCELTVEQTPVTGIAIQQGNTKIVKGSNIQLTASVEPADADNQLIIWKSLNEAIATVNADGMVTAISNGTAEIVATAAGNTQSSASCLIEVVTLASNISLNETTITLAKTQTAELFATIGPNDTSDKAVSWKSEDVSIATVDANGVVTAVGLGETTITATTHDGSNLSVSCKIIVDKTLVSDIMLSQVSVSMKNGEQIFITATIMPEDASDKSIEWTTDDPDSEIIMLNEKNGKIVALAPGMVTITATAQDGSGVSATCIVIVEEESGINDIQNDAQDEMIYDLTGRRKSKASQGFNIIHDANGKSRIDYQK